MSSLSRSRNYGIDLLRIVSMMMVCLLHILGAILPTTKVFSLHYEIGWLLETGAYGAVNLYALISGYVGVNTKPRYTGLACLWLQVVSYTVLITAGFFVLRPDGIHYELILKALFPVSFSQYWYFTAYVCLFFAMPLLNHLLNTLPKRTMRNTLLVFFVLFSVVPTVFQRDTFCVVNGYTFVWLMYLYLVGGYLQKHRMGEHISAKRCLVVYGICIGISWLFKLFVDLLTTKISLFYSWSNVLITYISPTIVIGSVALLLCFSKLSLSRIAKGIAFLSPLAFGVYIIHTHPLLFVQLRKWVASFAALPLPLFLLAVFGTLIGLYAVCSGIEYLRQRLFAALKIKERIARCEERLTERFRKPAPCEDKTTEEAYYVSK